MRMRNVYGNTRAWAFATRSSGVGDIRFGRPARHGFSRHSTASSTSASSGESSGEVVVVSGLPRGNPPRSLAFKLKTLLGLRATPTLLQRPATSEALLLTHSDADARAVRRVCATAVSQAATVHPPPPGSPAELGLGPNMQLSLRALPATADLMGDPVDERPWGAHVLRAAPESSLATGPQREVDQATARVDVGITAERVLRRGGTDPKGLTVALGGFDDHFEQGVYLCAGCHSPLYSSEMKFSCGCGWPAFWDCVKGALYERRDGTRGELVCSSCDGHIGHIYRNEGFQNPPPNERHCVNSSALVFRQEATDAAELVRPGYVGAVYMQTYTEDSVTIYEGLEGAVDAHKVASHAGQSFHGVAKSTDGAVGDSMGVDIVCNGKQVSTQDKQVEQELTLITLRHHVRGTEPAHILDVATATLPRDDLSGGLAGLRVGGGLESLAAALESTTTTPG